MWVSSIPSGPGKDKSRNPHQKIPALPGLAHAREQGKPHGRPQTTAQYADEVKLFKKGKGLSKRAIAKKLKIGRASVDRLLDAK